MNSKDKTWLICPIAWIIAVYIATFLVMITCFITTDVSIEALITSNKVNVYCTILIGSVALLLVEIKENVFKNQFNYRVSYRDFISIAFGVVGIALFLSGANLFFGEKWILGFMGTPYSEFFEKDINKDVFFCTILAPIGQVISLIGLIFYPIRKKINFGFTAAVSGLLFCLPYIDLRWEVFSIIPMGVVLLYIIEKTKSVSTAIIALQIYYILTFLMYMIGDNLNSYKKIAIMICGIICISVAIWIYKTKETTYEKAVKIYSPKEKLNFINMGIILLAIIEVIRAFYNKEIILIPYILLLLTVLWLFSRGRDYNKESNGFFWLEYITVFSSILNKLDENIFWMGYIYGLARIGSWIFLYSFALSVADEGKKKKVKKIYTILICAIILLLVISLMFEVVFDMEVFASYRYIRILTAGVYFVSFIVIRKHSNMIGKEKEIVE